MPFPEVFHRMSFVLMNSQRTTTQAAHIPNMKRIDYAFLFFVNVSGLKAGGFNTNV